MTSVTVQELPVPDPLVARLFRAHYRDVYRHLLRLSGDRQLAEELAQQVFVDAATALPRFKPGSTPELGLLYTIAQRRWVDSRRRARRRGPTLSLTDTDAPIVESDAHAAQALRAALDALPPDLRHLALSKLVFGRTAVEIATELGINEEACRKRIRRAEQALRRELERRGYSPRT